MPPITREGVLGLPELPEDIFSVSKGFYAIKPTDVGFIEADDDQIKRTVWFQTPAFTPTTIEKIRKLQLFTVSHDQGFCDEGEKGNWTWFEVAIMETAESNEPRVKDGIELSWVSHKSPFKTTESEWKDGKVFDKRHDIFRLLEDGNVIAVRLCARFQAWAIYAETAYLVVKFGDKMRREPVQYGRITSEINGIQAVFKEVNSNILSTELKIPELPPTLFRAGMMESAGERPLRVLSLDGGGVRGLAALELLKVVMDKAAPGQLPCNVFDMIGGTSTGGFIAIMLGRLQMSIQDCIDEYRKFMNIVFPTGNFFTRAGQKFKSSKWSAEPLENCIKDLVKRKLGDAEALLRDPDGPCKVFVMATKVEGGSSHAPARFRSYDRELEKSTFANVKIWQAARATSAAPSYFDPMNIDGHEFLDGGLQANNPLGWLWNEMLDTFGPARHTNCFLSIGTGIPASENIESNWHNIGGFTKSMAGLATNSEISNILFRSLINAFCPQPITKKYWRLNVGEGLPDWVVDEVTGHGQWIDRGQRKGENLGELDDVALIESTVEKARNYLKGPEAAIIVEECAEALRVKFGQNDKKEG